MIGAQYLFNIYGGTNANRGRTLLSRDLTFEKKKKDRAIVFEDEEF